MFSVDKRWQSNFKDKKTATTTTNNELSQSNENMKIPKQVSTLAGSAPNTLNMLCGGRPPFNGFQSRLDLFVCACVCVCVRLSENEWLKWWLLLAFNYYLYANWVYIQCNDFVLRLHSTRTEKKPIICSGYGKFSTKEYTSLNVLTELDIDTLKIGYQDIINDFPSILMMIKIGQMNEQLN